jgi:FKBP-type peptidyl-prolyl cis-trans isomerase (trigger factor)
MQKETTRAEDGTITLKITIPWKDVEEERSKVVDNLAKKVQVPGFRKGTAPKKVAEKHLKKEAVQEELLKNVLGKAYNDAVKEENLSPIITPKVHVDTFEDGTDLTFSAELCEAPDVTLGDYKKAVSTITAKSKIVVPGKEQEKPNLDEILESILTETNVSIPKVLYQQEANRLLSQTLDELKSLGLSLEQYLSSRDKTAEQMRVEYEEKAKKDLTLEFVLRKIADSEKITVENSDIENAIKEVKDEKQKQQIMSNPYMVASIIRQQKTLDFLSKL